MPSCDYNLLFNVPNDAILKFLDDLIARLTKVDQLVTPVKPKIASMASGASRSGSGAGQAARDPANNMAKVELSNDARGAGKVRTQSVGTGQSIKVLGPTATTPWARSGNGPARACT